MENLVPAEVFPPGEFLNDELKARGWSQTDLAEIMGRSINVVNEVISAKRGVTPETAQALADALGGSAQFWLNLESMYRLSLLTRDDGVSRRAKLYAKAPVREMIRRHWIEESRDVEILERQIMDFFEISDLDATPRFAHAARKSTSYKVSPSPSQSAWLYRARQLAPAAPLTGSFSRKSLASLLNDLHELTEAPENTRHVPKVLSDYGIRFLMIEPLAGTKIDGAAFWLDDSPVIVLSLRYDRIDHFWHTLMHEIGHFSNRDKDAILDTEIVSDTGTGVGSEKPEPEQRADAFATNALVPQARMDDFVLRVRPLFSAVRVQNFARTMRVHAGIVVGQLQHRHEIDYRNLRRLLVPVRDVVTSSALTDGWGSQLPAAI